MYEINRAAIIGAGTMGLGIADCVMNRDRLLKTAIDATLWLSYDCYPARRAALSLPGREVWHLAKTAETRARIGHMLEYGSPLRN